MNLYMVTLTRWNTSTNFYVLASSEEDAVDKAGVSGKNYYKTTFSVKKVLI